MTKEEQEKLGREIVERLNKGESVNDLDISSFYNIKQFRFIKTKRINLISNEFYIIVLPEDNEGNSLLEVRFWVYKNSCNNEIILSSIVLKCYIYNNIYNCFTKFKLTWNFSYPSNLDYWLVRDEKFEWILEYLKEDDPEYNLAMYELYGFNEEYVRKTLKKIYYSNIFYGII